MGPGELVGRPVPDIVLESTGGEQVRLADPVSEPSVLFFYPRTGRVDVPVPQGWTEVPGAQGCTLEARNFAARYDEFTALGLRIFGVSSQTPAYQQEAARRLGLPFPLLSDPTFSLADGLGLPTFVFAGSRLMTRSTLVIAGGVVARAELGILDAEAHPAALLAALSG